MSRLPYHAITALLIGQFATTQARALEVSPGDYEQFPVNSSIGLLYYQFGHTSDLYSDGNKVSSNASTTSNIGSLRGLHVYEIAPGVTVDPQFILPVGGIMTGGILAPLGSPAGVGDVLFAAPIKIKLDTEFNDIFAITPYLIAPTGTYLSSRGLNLGSNRWSGDIQLAYVKHFTQNLSLDFVADAQFFSDNSSYFSKTSGVLRQNTLFELQSYLRYRIDPKFEVAGGLGGKLGGRQSFEGASLDNSLGTGYGRLAATYFIEPTVQVQLELGRDLAVQSGLKQDAFVQLRIAKIVP